MDNTINDNQASEQSEEIFYPSFVFKEICVAVMIFILVAFILAVVFPVGLEDPADPTDASYLPKPEWYFLGLYQLQKYFPVKLEVIATFIIPNGMFILMVLLPFIDKNKEIRPMKRPKALVSIVVIMVGLGVLTILGVLS